MSAPPHAALVWLVSSARPTLATLAMLLSHCTNTPPATTSSDSANAEAGTPRTPVDGGAGTGSAPDSGANTSPDPGPSMLSGTIPQGAGRHAVTVDYKGVKRSVVLAVPSRDAGSSRALVFVGHGAGEGAEKAAEQYGLVEKAGAKGWIVAFAEGLADDPTNRTYNAMSCCGYAHKNNVDDVGFAHALIQTLVTTFQIPKARVFATGFSNGGMLAHRIAAERPGLLAAISDVGGSVGGVSPVTNTEATPPKPNAPTSVQIVHGKKDPTVPYAGGKGDANQSFLSVDASRKFWTDANACPEPAAVSAKAGATVARYAPCRDGSVVEVVSVDEGKHTWHVMDAAGQTTADVVLRFFEEVRPSTGSTKGRTQ